jgi:hypothetical protein
VKNNPFAWPEDSEPGDLPGGGNVYERSTPRAAPTVTDEDRAFARELIAAGYEQVSAKYRHVARLPEGMTGIEALAMHDPGELRRIQDEIERRCAATFRRVFSSVIGTKCAKTLTPGQFKAFKDAGGKVSL